MGTCFCSETLCTVTFSRTSLHKQRLPRRLPFQVHGHLTWRLHCVSRAVYVICRCASSAASSARPPDLAASLLLTNCVRNLQVGLVGGFLGACTGLGGAIVIIPGLSSFTSLSPHKILGTSTLVCGTFLLCTIRITTRLCRYEASSNGCIALL